MAHETTEVDGLFRLGRQHRSGRRIHVLFVDDDPEVLCLARIFFEADGQWSVDTAFDAYEALLKLERDAFDAIVSDYQMPSIDGIELLKLIRKRGNLIPFILFTGSERAEVATEACNSGADFFVRKDGSGRHMFRVLQRKIISAIEKRRVMEEHHGSLGGSEWETIP